MKSDGGRHGVVETATEGLRVSFRKEDNTGATPEHLFAGAYAACFYSAVESAAERAHKTIPGLSIVANVALEEDAPGGWSLAVELRAAMPGISRSDGEHLLNLAHQSCPYSKALRGKARVSLVFDKGVYSSSSEPRHRGGRYEVFGSAACPPTRTRSIASSSLEAGTGLTK